MRQRKLPDKRFLVMVIKDYMFGHTKEVNWIPKVQSQRNEYYKLI